MSKIPEPLKRKVQEEAERLVEVLMPQCIEPPPQEPRFNCLTGLYTKWRGSYLYLCGTYACPGPEALSPSFEARFSRLEYAGGNRFNLAYMRHTGQWCEVYQGLTLDEAIETIREEPLFHP